MNRSLAAFVLASFSALAFGQAPLKCTYEPTSGQEGKDVVWIPTPQVVVDRMLDLAKVNKSDYVMDLGSGDGRTVITAARRGARAMGVEYNPDLVEYAKCNAAKEGMTARATFVKQDLFETDFSQATVITMFLLPDINLKLRPKILNLRPGTRIVSNTFTMGDWKEDDKAELGSNAGCTASWCTALLWIVPAKVAGTHRIPQGSVTFKQTYQVLSGNLSADGKTYALEGKVHGDEVTFRAGGKSYRGRMVNGKLEMST